MTTVSSRVPRAPELAFRRVAPSAFVAPLFALLAIGACKRSPPPPTRDVAASDKLVPWLHSPNDYGFVTREGNAAFTGRFSGVHRFHEGRAAVAFRDGKWGFIDGDGKTVVPSKYDLVGDFHDGRARVFRFRRPILGPVHGMILREGELTESTIDLEGHESGEKKTPANVLPSLSDWPLFEEHAPAPTPVAPRWETFAGPSHALGLREIESKRVVLPPNYEEVRFIEDADGSGVKFLAARKADAPLSGWSVHDLAGRPIQTAAFDIGMYSSEGCFTIATLSEAGDSTWSAVDSSGRVVASVPYAAGAFLFRDGIAEVSVADVGPIFVSRSGRLFADLGPVDARHRAVGRPPIVGDAGPR